MKVNEIAEIVIDVIESALEILMEQEVGGGPGPVEVVHEAAVEEAADDDDVLMMGHGEGSHLQGIVALVEGNTGPIRNIFNQEWTMDNIRLMAFKKTKKKPKGPARWVKFSKALL